MKKLISFTLLTVLCASLFTGCDNIATYKSDDNDSYHIGSFYSGGDKNVTDSKITKVSAMNRLGNERIILHIENKNKNEEKLPYYELQFGDEDKEDFTFTVYSASLDTDTLVAEDDFDLIENIEIIPSDGYVKIYADCDDKLKYKVEENTDSMQIVICIKEINAKEK